MIDIKWDEVAGAGAAWVESDGSSEQIMRNSKIIREIKSGKTMSISENQKLANRLKKEHDIERNKQRRERIATAALQGMLARSHVGMPTKNKNAVRYALEYADALIAELDKPVKEEI